KYNRCHWLQILALNEHYARAELEVDVADDGSVEFKEPVNVAVFSFRPPVAPKKGARLRIGGREVAPLPSGDGRPGDRYVRAGGDRWRLSSERIVSAGKRPGLQGPIDDAFTAPFLCVRGTGKAWNPAVQAYAEASLKRFGHEWRRYFRGEL